MLRILDVREAAPLFRNRTLQLEKATRVVAQIIDAVRKRGDRALLYYARRFDGLNRNAKTVAVPAQEINLAFRRLPPPLKTALKQAASNIRRFAKLQLPKPWTVTIGPGVRLGQLVRPLEAVGAYVPSGRYPLPSTLLMTVIPASVAGVPKICVASPNPSPELLATAGFLKVSNFFRMGGAHAIAAFAFGTETVPKVDRIVGPGNIYVTAAKKLLAGEVGIDFIAGPTEIVIVADDVDPAAIAADLLAQAEHDTDATALLLTPNKRLARLVAAEVERQLRSLPTMDTARQALQRNCAIVVVPSIDAAIELANTFAPEHLTIPSRRFLPMVQNAGSVFIGPFSPEAAGDYASGTNHVLPTGGVARIRGGLSAADFVKTISFQELTRNGLRRLAPAITTLARAEGLEAHARSVEVRLND